MNLTRFRHLSRLLKLAAVSAVVTAASAVHAGATFDAVKQRGQVLCGISDGIPGFSVLDGQGQWRGIEVDLCRAVAAAMFNDATRLRLVSLSSQQRFTSLQSGEVDMLVQTVTQTLARDTTLGLIGVGVHYYDSQGIMVSKQLGVTSARDLSGATVCVQMGTTTELNLADWFRAHDIAFTPIVIDNFDEIIRAFMIGRCDAYTSEKSILAAVRNTMLEKPGDYLILPEDLSKEPLGPMVRQGDEQWFNVVRWTMNAMLEAEEYGITSENVDDMLHSSNPNVQRILGVTPGMGRNLGVDDRWAYAIIKQVGNYGESFDATIGKHSAMGLERGLNAQWRDGGLMYGWPIR